EEENIVYLPPYVELSSRKKSQYKSAPLEERNERDEDKSEIPLTGEVLRRACESWIKAVEEFRRVEEKSYVDNK
ncbi:9284_t:CDS:2, partial [Gigaspora rosea]